MPKFKGADYITLSHTEKILQRRGFGIKKIMMNNIPMSLSKSKIKNTIDEIDFETPYGYCLKTLYTNFNRMEPTETKLELIDLTKQDNISSYERE